MNDTSFIGALSSPAIFAVLTMVILDRNGRSSLLAKVVTAVFAFIVGYAIVFTVAWSVAVPGIVIWLIALMFGILVGLVGQYSTRRKLHG